VRFSKVVSLACACALIFSSSAPLQASSFDGDVRLTATTNAPVWPSVQTEVRAESAAEFETAQAANAGAKKRPNLFLRIISAPFRGLAKLFGGKGGDQAARAKTEEVRPKEAATATVATERAANVSASPVVAPPTRAPEAAEESADYEPRKFTPFIEGAAGDPLSQGRALLESGYPNEAIAELSVAAVAGPDLVEANNLLGLAYDRRGQHKQAQEFYERALSVAPLNPRVLNNLGHSLYLDDRYDESLSRLKTAARLAPADTQVAGNLALVYGRLGKYDDAFKQFKRAGGEFYARTNTAALLAAAGRDRDAIKHYEAARKLNPASSLVLRQLITLYVRTGQREKAEAAERALDKTADKASAVS
jgi:Flp pilus assembly protein TadD